MEVGLVLGQGNDPGASVANPRIGAYVILTIDVSASAIYDLTTHENRQKLRTSAQELTGDWRGYHQRNPRTALREPVGPSPTQRLGAALHASGRFEAFISFSAKVPYEPVLCVFPDRLRSSSSLEYAWVDPTGAPQTRRIPPRL